MSALVWVGWGSDGSPACSPCGVLGHTFRLCWSLMSGGSFPGTAEVHQQGVSFLEASELYPFVSWLRKSRVHWELGREQQHLLRGQGTLDAGGFPTAAPGPACRGLRTALATANSRGHAALHQKVWHMGQTLGSQAWPASGLVVSVGR